MLYCANFCSSIALVFRFAVLMFSFTSRGSIRAGAGRSDPSYSCEAHHEHSFNKNPPLSLLHSFSPPFFNSRSIKWRSTTFNGGAVIVKAG